MRGIRRDWLLPALLGIAVACGGASAEAYLTSAEEHLATGSFDQAAEAAEKGLEANPTDDKVRWRLELAHLEAQARSGDTAGATATLERLAEREGTVVKGSHYVSSADQLKAAGDAAGAIELLDKGLKRFPEDADLTKALEQAMASGGDDEQDMLKSLGYIQ